MSDLYDEEVYEEDDLDNIVTLQDEEGNEVEFEFLDLIQYDDKEYVVLLPTDENDNEVVILQLEEVDDEIESYLSVEDEETLYEVFEIFKEANREYFIFDEEEN